MRVRQIQTLFKILFWLFYGPIWIGKLVYRKTGYACGELALRGCDAVRCPACGEAVSLFARWECAWCGRVFDGFAFGRCPSRGCGAVPPFIECQSCGVSIDNPSLF